MAKDIVLNDLADNVAIELAPLETLYDHLEGKTLNDNGDCEIGRQELIRISTTLFASINNIKRVAGLPV